MGSNRTDCPACGRPLRYDAEHDSMVCPMGHYSEPIKNDLHVDSHDSVVNNYYQGATHQMDNRGSYDQMVQRLQAFIVDKDMEGFKKTIHELRSSYPQTYFGKLANVWLFRQGDCRIFHGPSLYDICYELRRSASDPAHLKFDVEHFARVKFGLDTSRPEPGTTLGDLWEKHASKNGIAPGPAHGDTYIEFSIQEAKSILAFLSSANLTSLKGLVKYQFEADHYNAAIACSSLLNNALKDFADLQSSMQKYAEEKGLRVDGIVENTARDQLKSVDLPYPYSGLTMTCLCLATEVLAIVFGIVGTVLTLLGTDVTGLTVLAMLLMIAHIPFLIIRNNIMDTLGAPFYAFNGVVIGLFLIAFALPTGYKSINLIPGTLLCFPSFVRNLIQLPECISDRRYIRERKAEYYANVNDAANFYHENQGNVEFKSLSEMAASFKYDFSRWNM